MLSIITTKSSREITAAIVLAIVAVIIIYKL